MRNAFVLLLAVFPLGAQQSSAPPPVLQIFREDIKEGKGAAHEKSEAAFMQAVAKANYTSHILGMTAMTGTSQAWFLEGHATFASIAEAQAALDKPEFEALDATDAELRTGSQSMIAVYRADLSYAADKADLYKMRFFNIETIRLAQGPDQKFEEAAKALIAGAVKAGDSQPLATYEVVSGAPNGTYLLLEPMASLKSLDEEPQRRRALRQAMTSGDPERNLAASIANSEWILFVVNPQMSYVPKEWIAADPAYWEPKPVKPAQTPAKPHVKAAKKPASK
jgi:hypothetical protein